MPTTPGDKIGDEIGTDCFHIASRRVHSDPQIPHLGGSHPFAVRTKMPTVALQVRVTDYAKWRPIFDQYRSARAQAGFKHERVFRNVDDPNEVIIWGEATSGSKLRRALASPELKAAMKEAGGVDGTLKLHVIPFSSDAVIA
jgi:hypothetical protein